MDAAADLLDRGRSAVSVGQWADAETALVDLAREGSLEATLLLGEVYWWQSRVDDALAMWGDGCRLARQAGHRDVAARLAAWVSYEYAALGNPASADGWLARAGTLLGGGGGDPAGWVSLARAARADLPAEQERQARDALDVARAEGDGDLEILALARLGLARIRDGSFGEGLRCFDEAMAGATGGEAARLRTVGTVSCDLVLAVELTGDVERFARWRTVLEAFVEARGYPSVMGFCATCCAQVQASQGDWGGAEQQLRAAVVGLFDTGRTARCVPPAAKLAELLVLQGRLEEAEALLGEDDEGESLLARAHLALARGDPALAGTLAARCARNLAGDTLVRVAAGAALVEARLADGDLTGAGEAQARLETLVEGTGSRRAEARAAVARGRLALAVGDDATATGAFEGALDAVAGVQGSIEAAEAHLELARLHAASTPTVARAEARAALRAFDAVAATRGADRAAELLRTLGDHSRVGPKGVGLLTQREQEILRLVGAGLTNAEIAARLFISPKTAGNHVSSILSKLNLRSRTEAAAYAVLHPDLPAAGTV